MEIMRNAECGMRNERKGSGFGVQDSRWGIANCKLEAIKNCKLQSDNGRWKGRNRKRFHSSFILYPSSLISHPHPSRRGLSLMEVLISIFVLVDRAFRRGGFDTAGPDGAVGNSQGRSLRGLRPGRFARNPSRPHASTSATGIGRLDPTITGNCWGYLILHYSYLILFPMISQQSADAPTPCRL